MSCKASEYYLQKNNLKSQSTVVFFPFLDKITLKESAALVVLQFIT